MYYVLITRTEDGETRLHVEAENWQDEGHHWLWTEGNWGCDCNRELWHLRARDEDEPDDPQCSDGQYRIRVYDDNGELCYTEFDGEEEDWYIDPWGRIARSVARPSGVR